MANFGGANRIELESQILCAALRQSWQDTDATGMVKACQELSQVFPDLLPPPCAQLDNPSNYYEVLGIDCDVNPPKIIAAYFVAVKKFLRENPKPRSQRNEYYRLLNAGFLLRKPRSRLSHDLIVVRKALVENHVIPEDGTLQLIDESIGVEPVEVAAIVLEETIEDVATEAMDAESMEEEYMEEECMETESMETESMETEAAETESFEPEPGADAAESVAPVEEEPVKEVEAPPQEALPILMELLMEAQFVGALEVQALKNQMKLYPDIPLADLVMHSGYVAREEMKSLLLAEFLIVSGKITLKQFKVILSEKRTWTNIFFPPG